MTRSGRPLRFLAATIAGWTALRVFMLWPAAKIPNVVIRMTAPRLAAARNVRVAPGEAAHVAFEPATARRAPRDDGRNPARAPHLALALTGPARFDGLQIALAPPGQSIAPAMPPLSLRSSVPRPATRWTADLWLVARAGGSRHAGFGGGELGGAQAGARLGYALDRAHRLAAFVRIDSPLGRGQRETAFGLDWRPTGIPLRLVIEERIPLDGAKAAPAAGLVGGFGPVLRRGLRLEGYGQAGVIARRGGEGFADGAVRVTRPIAKLGDIAFDLGAGAWGGAQRNAARLDLGPTLGLSVPVGEHAIRVALDWRARVAGHARPGSGPALTIGASF